MDEQAFPMMTHDDPLYGGRIVGQRGMTLRDYFAAAALTGILAREGWPSDLASRSAYLVADAMLKARENKNA